MKYFFFIVLVLHAIIHLVGFIKSFNLIEISHLTQRISKPQGILWLICSLLFFFCLFAFWMGFLWWWMIAIPTVILSQILIFFDWKEAGYGTVANLILLLAIAVGVGQWTIEMRINEKLKSLSTVKKIEVPVKNELDTLLNNLPESVQRWLISSHALTRKVPAKVYISQSGTLRTSPEGKWMSFRARQWSNPSNPAFVWKADVRLFPGFYLAGLDSYINEKGNMLISMMSVIPLVNAEGDEINQGSLLRWLGEMVWYPQSALHPAVIWEEIDNNSASATISHSGQTATGIFTFDKKGDIRSFKADRYFDNEGSYNLEEWEITVNEMGYHSFSGIRVPTDLKVSWNLKEGKFHWLNLKVDTIEFIYR